MKRAFTLVEMLAVITIIGLLALITIPAIDSIIRSSKDDVYQAQENLIIDALKDYASENVFNLNATEPNVVTLAELKQEGFVDVELRNPKTDECFNNDLELIITKENNKFVYEINKETLNFFASDSCEVDSSYEKDNDELKLYVLGSNPYKLNIDDLYEEPGIKFKDASGNLTLLDSDDITYDFTTQLVYSEGNIRLYMKYEEDSIKYELINSSDRLIKTRKIELVDNVKPVIVANDRTISVTERSIDLLEGVTVTDNSNKEVDLQVKSQVSLGVIGTYEVEYIATDWKGNVATKIIQVKVVDDINPRITSLSKTPSSWTSTKVRLTATAIDNETKIAYYQFSTDPSLNSESEGFIKNKVSGEVTLTKDVTSNATWYLYVKDAGNNMIKSSIVVDKIDLTVPTLKLTSTTATQTSINISYTTSDLESGIDKVICYYGTNLNYGFSVNGTNGACNITGLKIGTTYYLKVVSTNNASGEKIRTTSINTLLCNQNQYGAVGASGCSNCPSGYISGSNTTSQNNCYVNLKAGEYKTKTGLPTTCPAGTYYSTARTGYYNQEYNCNTCEAGYYCSGGSKHVSCGTGRSSKPGATSASECYDLTYAASVNTYTGTRKEANATYTTKTYNGTIVENSNWEPEYVDNQWNDGTCNTDVYRRIKVYNCNADGHSEQVGWWNQLKCGSSGSWSDSSFVGNTNAGQNCTISEKTYACPGDYHADGQITSSTVCYKYVCNGTDIGGGSSSTCTNYSCPKGGKLNKKTKMCEF